MSSGIRSVERRFRVVAEVAARGSRRVFRIVHRELSKVCSRAEPLREHRSLPAGFRLVCRFVVLAVVDRGVGTRRNDDLCQVVLRFHEVELAAIRAVEVGDVLIRDRNLRDDLTVQQLFDGKLPPDVALQVVNGQPRFLQLALKLFFGVGAFRGREFVFHLGVAGDEVHFAGALQQNFTIDQLVEDAQLQGERSPLATERANQGSNASGSSFPLPRA